MTLVGLKLLMSEFAKDKVMWKLIAMKARTALKYKFNGDIKSALAQLTVILD